MLYHRSGFHFPQPWAVSTAQKRPYSNLFVLEDLVKVNQQTDFSFVQLLLEGEPGPPSGIRNYEVSFPFAFKLAPKTWTGTLKAPRRLGDIAAPPAQLPLGSRIGHRAQASQLEGPPLAEERIYT